MTMGCDTYNGINNVKDNSSESINSQSEQETGKTDSGSTTNPQEKEQENNNPQGENTNPGENNDPQGENTNPGGEDPQGENTNPGGEDPQEKQFETYSRVVILGVDGGGRFFEDTDTPNIDRIFADYATSYDVLTAYPTISAQCWGSMLMGVEPNIHGLTNNKIKYNRYDVDSYYPTIFRVFREANPDAVLASFCNWNAINYGLIESNLGVTEGTGTDFGVCNQVCNYLEENSPNLLFVQFDSVDGAGHKYGYGTKNHLSAITTIDGYIGQIYQKLEDKGLLEDTLFIVTADHGGTPEGDHGGDTDAEKYVFLGIAGKTVQKGEITQVEVRDIAAICATALGLDIPEIWTGRLPLGIFEGIGGGERKESKIYISPNRTHQTEPTPSLTTLEGILEDHNVIAYLPFDGSADNLIGDTTTTTNGKLYYSDAYFGEGVFLDDGYITLNDTIVGSDSFAVAFWINCKGVSGDPCIISNKDWENGKNDGFVLSFRVNDIKFNAGNDGVSRVDAVVNLPDDYCEGWMHVMLSVDRIDNTISLYLDFSLKTTEKIPTALKDVDFDSLSLNIGQDGTGVLGQNLPAQLDEFLFLADALTAEDVAALSSYYLHK